jgi:hypothetical protein
MAVPQGERIWVLDGERILSHVESGGTLAELRQFLEANAADGLTESVRDFLASIDHRIRAFRRAREAVLLEWEDQALVGRLAVDPATREHCMQAGSNWLVVPKDQLAPFRQALKKLGFVLPTGKPPVPDPLAQKG